VSFDGARTADAPEPTSIPDRPADGSTASPAVGPNDPVDAEPPLDDTRPAGGSRWSLGRVLALLAVAALVVAGVRTFLAQAFVIPSESMEPLLKVGDRVLVSRLDYRIGGIHRGDVIVFDGEGVFDAPANPARSPLAAAGRAVAAALGAPVGENDYVKRVIGLPGERVVCCDTEGRLTVNGVRLSEPYLTVPPARATRFDIVVPPGRYWVMGDNRDDSGDSRAHLGDPGGGTVPKDHVIGRVVALWWPLGRAAGIGRVETSARGAQEDAP
jgi:signal peptidase I